MTPALRLVPRRPLIVMKFGGTSVGTVERIQSVARRALDVQRAGNDVVLVVSAMAGETNRLLTLAHQVALRPDARELDVVAATGEQVCVGLVAMAIQGQGGAARSLLGHQARLRTDNAFTQARIQRIELEAIRASLGRGEIPVVAGFQGVDGEDNITTLGRGGSDTTAVALAAALRADLCDIYTDVDGVYTADPRVCPLGRRLSFIPYEEMLVLSSLGAKVLQARSVEIAMKYGVPVRVRSSFSSEPGTWIVNREEALEERALTGIACERRQVRVELTTAEHRPELTMTLVELLSAHGVSADMLHASRAPGQRSGTALVFTLSEDDLRRVRPHLGELEQALGADTLTVLEHQAKVSLVGIGVRSDPAIAVRLYRSLLSHGLSVSAFLVSELRASFLVDESAADQAVCALHDEFNLGAEAQRAPAALDAR